MSRSALFIIIAIAIGAAVAGVAIVTIGAEGEVKPGKHLALDLNENLALKGNP